MLNKIEKRSKEKIPNLEIYTDGSCKKLGREMTFGGLGFFLCFDFQYCLKFIILIFSFIIQ